MGNININVGVQLEADQKKLQNQINSLGDKLSLAIKAEKLEVGKVKIDSSKIQDAINESGKDLELKVAKIALLESALTDLQKELDAIGEKLKLDIGNVNVEEIKISQQALQNKLNSLDFNNLNLGNVSLNEITFESQEMMFKAFAKKHGIAYTESFKDSLKSALANGESITQIITSAAEDVVAKPEKAARELYKQELERLKAFRDGIAGVANGKKLAVGEMFDKEELKELNSQLKGTLILTKDVGTYADKVMSEVIDIGARSGIEINGVLEDQIKAMAAGIQEWKNFKNNVKAADFNMYSDDYLNNVKADIDNLVISIYQASNGAKLLDDNLEEVGEQMRLVGDTTSEIKKISETVGAVDKSGGAIAFKEGLISVEQFKKAIESVKDSMLELSGTTTKTDKYGNVTEAVVSYRNELGSTITETYKLVELQDELGNKTGEWALAFDKSRVSENYDKMSRDAEKHLEKIKNLEKATETFAESMAKVVNYDVVDEKQLDKLQKKFSELTIDSSKTEITAVQKELDKLIDKCEEVKKVQAGMFGKVDRISASGFIDVSDINSIKEKINSLSTTSSKAEIEELQQAIISLGKQEKDIESMYNKMSKAAEKSAKEQQKEIENINKAYAKHIVDVEKAKRSLTDSLNNISVSGLINTSAIDKLQEKINSIDAKTSIDEIKALEKEVKNLGGSQSQILKLSNTISQLQVKLNKLNAKSKIDLLNGDELTQVKALESEIYKLENTMSELKNGVNMTGEQIRNATSSATNNIKELQSQTVKATSSAYSLRDAFDSITNIALGTSIGNFIGNSVQNAVSSSWNVIRDIDDGVRDLKRVMGDASINYDEFVSNANNVARGIGRTTQETILATTEFKKAGYNIELITGDVEGAAFNLQEAGLVLSNVADMSIEDSVKAIVSTLKGFGTETKDVVETANQIVDLINESGNVFAMSSQDMAEMMRIASASLSLAGNDINEAGALMVAGFEVIQDAPKVANGLKTIGMRLRGVSEDGEELNAKLGELVKTYTGVDLTDANGQFRNTYDVIKDLSVVLNQMEDGDPIKAMILEEVAGKNQANVLAAIVKNYQQLGNAYDTLSKSSGSAAAEQEAFIQSLSGQLNQLKESFVGMLLSIADTGSITSLVSVLNTVVGGITSVVDAFGSLKGVVGNFGVMITSLITIMATCTKGGRDLAGAFTSIVPGVNKAKSALDGLIAKYKQNTVETEKLIKAKKEEISKLSVGSSAYKKAGNELSVLSGKLVLAKAKTVALTVASVALNAAITMGASLLISAGVNALTKWINKTSEAAEASKEFTDSLDSIGDKKLKLDDILNAKTGVEQIKALENELGSLEEGTDAYIETAGKLETAKKNLIGLYGSMTEVIEDETGAKSLNLEATEKLIGKELELAKASATALLERNKIFSSSDIKKEIAEYEKYAKVVSDVRKAANEGYSGSGGYSTKNLDKYIKKMEESKTNLEAYHSALKILGDDVGWATASFNDLSNALNITSNSNFDIVNAQGNIGEAFDATTDSIESQIVSLDKLIEKYSGLNEPIALLEKAISEFAEMGTIHNDTYNSILTSGNAQMIALLGDVDTFASESMKLLEEWKKSRADAAEEIIKSSMQEVAAVKGAVQEEVDAYTEAEVEKTNASINGTNERTQSEADAANTNANTYSNDASNHGNAEQTKSINEANSASDRTQTEANAANTNAGTYANDATNHGNAEGAKVQNEVDSANERINVEALTNEQLEQLYMNNEITFGEYLKGCLEKYKQWALSIWEAAKNLFNKIIFGSKKATDAMTGEDTGEITDELVLPEGIKPSGNAIKPSGNAVKPTGSNYKPVSSSGTTSSAANKNNSSTKKDVENLENLADRYYYLNNALKVVENQLQSVDTAMENANESKKIGLLDQEIALLYKKKEALEAIRAENNRELNDIRRQLSSNGFRFNSDGSISNYASQIKALTDAANRLTGDAKKNAIDNVKDLVSKINDYTKLLYDDIPDITDKINEMSNAVISSQKEIAEILSKQRDEYIENLEKETDVLKKELEKRKELLKKQWDEEDAQDELKSKQDTLNELEESLAIALREGDSETVKSIREQIAAAQKEINDFIRDAERDYVTDVIDKDIDKLDEDLKDQIDYINETLGEGELLALVQNGVRDLSDTLNNIGSVTRQVNTSFASVTRTISNDWINALDSFVSKLGAISNLNLGLDIGSIMPRGSLAGVGGINITQGNIVIEGNLTEDLLPQVERMIQNSNNELIREINNALTR